MLEQTLIDNFNSKWELDAETGCWNWTASLAGKGYGQIKKPKERKQYYAHRLSYEIHKGKIGRWDCVCHTCDNPKCVNPDHLFLGTSSDNHLDMKSKNRHTFGERNSESKLTEGQVKEILALRSHKISQARIAEMFGISQITVSRIHRGLRWAHLTP